MEIFCPHCKLENPPGESHCVMCGKPLPKQAPPPPPVGKRPPPQGKRPPPQGKRPPPNRPPPGKRPPGKRPPPMRQPRQGGDDLGTETVQMKMGDLFESDMMETTKIEGAKGGQGVKAPISRIKAGDFKPEEVKGWLCCDPFRPVPVGTKPVLVLGRRRDCDMILPHESVSKAHTMVRALGSEVVVEDRSTYGTYVNGKRVVSAPIKFGDTLTIGPYQIEFREEVERRSRAGEEDTKPFRTMASPEALSGRIEKVDLTEVLQQIEFYEKSGTLKVWEGNESAILVCYKGKPMFAEKDEGKLKDLEAVWWMLELKRGNFSFMSKVEAGEVSLDGTLTKLVMDFKRKEDEAAGGE